MWWASTGMELIRQAYAVGLAGVALFTSDTLCPILYGIRLFLQGITGKDLSAIMHTGG